MNVFDTLLIKLSNKFDYLIIRFAQWFGIDAPIALARFHYWFSFGETRPVFREILRRVSIPSGQIYKGV